MLVFLPASAAAQVNKPSTPKLIERAQERGAIGLERANLLRVYALRGDPRLPAAYQSSTPWRGTMVIHDLRRSVGRMDPGSERAAVVAVLRAPPDPSVTRCDISVAPLPDSIETTHFYIQYNDATIGGGLDVQDYAASLERAWGTEVESFRWAAPPASALAQEEIGGKYHVRIDALAPGLYGFVSPVGRYAETVNDNPSTPWNDQEAEATCMALNQDFGTGFPGTAPQQALDATTAHEFNHSIQYGYGALDLSETEPDKHIVEGSATWMEDEVQDASNDNYNYLYPPFVDSMGEYDSDGRSEYSYWLTFRGLTERFGANTPGGAEQVMQDYWEIVSREDAVQQTALNTALANKGHTLPGAFHDYAIAAKFMLTCGAPGVRPFCFEEATGYTAAVGGVPASHGSAGPGPHNGSLEDNHAINWVDLPTTGAYDVTLSNRSAEGGALRGTIACATGSGVAIAPFPAVVTAGQETTVPGFNSDSCPGTPVVAITNQSQTADNPSSSIARNYRVTVAAPSGATEPTVPPPVTEVPPDNGPAAAGPAAPAAGSVVAVTDLMAPTLSALTLSNRRFRTARSGRAITAAPAGVRVRYGISEAATLTVRYERRTTGRRVGGRCRRTTPTNRSRGKCFRWVQIRGSARRGARAGSNTFRLSGRWRGRALRPAVYRLRLSARDGAGNVSPPRRSRSFRIVRR